jgi:type IV pilus assembly protein PilC
MSEYVLKYADARGEVRQQVAKANSEQELRDKYTKQGFMIYSIKPKGGIGAMSETGFFAKKKKLNLEKFLIFNSQFVTLIRAGLPILKALDLLADRLTDPKLGP